MHMHADATCAHVLQHLRQEATVPRQIVPLRAVCFLYYHITCLRTLQLCSYMDYNPCQDYQKYGFGLKNLKRFQNPQVNMFVPCGAFFPKMILRTLFSCNRRDTSCLKMFMKV